MANRVATNSWIVLATVPTTALLLTKAGGTTAAVLTLLAAVSAMAAARSTRGSSALPAALWPAVGILMLSALVHSPITSHDLWSYAFAGRSVSAHGLNPYVSTASAYPNDLVSPLVGWRDTPLVYGPLFGAVAAAITALAGDSLLLIRLGFQALAGMCVCASLSIMARRGSRATLVLVALQPFVWISVVNGGHNDALMALLLLVAVLAFQSNGFWVTALLITAAAMVKMTAGLVVVPLLGVLLARRQWRDAGLVAAVPGLSLLFGQILLPGSLTNAFQATGSRVSMASVWHPLQVVTGLSGHLVGMGSMGLVVVLVGLIAWSRRLDEFSFTTSGASLAVFGLGSSYTLPWYSIWGLPLLALGGDSVATALVAARGSLMLAAYQMRGSFGWSPLGVAALTVAAPAVLLVAFVLRVRGGDLHLPRKTGPDRLPAAEVRERLLTTPAEVAVTAGCPSCRPSPS